MHWFIFTSFCVWFWKLESLSQPIRCKIETNHNLVTHVLAVWLFLPWESLLDWPFCSSNFSFSLRLQLIQFSSFDNIVCFSITGGQDQNDRVWVLGVLVRTGLKAKIVFHPWVLSIGFYLKEISSWKLSSIVSNWSGRSSEEHCNFPFPNQKNVQMRF